MPGRVSIALSCRCRRAGGAGLVSGLPYSCGPLSDLVWILVTDPEAGKEAGRWWLVHGATG